MPIFDAMDGPVHATLHDAARTRRLRGWALLGVSIAGLVLLLALSKEDDAVYALVTGALMTPVFWWLDGRPLRGGLASIRPATAQATVAPTAPARLLRGPAAVAVLIVLSVLTGLSAAPVVVAIALGAADLIAAGTLIRWERRHGKRLFVTGGELFSR